MQGTARDGGGRMLPWRLTVKTLREPDAADDDARSPNHWTFWRREALAYESELLPHNNHRLDSVECFDVFSDDRHEGGVAVALGTVDAEAIWDLDQFAEAAGLLGQWQAGWVGRVPPIEWLAQDQLNQRIRRTDANGGLVEPAWSRPALAAAARDRLRSCRPRSSQAVPVALTPTRR